MRQIGQHVEEAAAWVRARWANIPRVGVILGTGLGPLAEEIEAAQAFPYDDIPHMPRSTAVSHRGALVCGTLAGVPVVAMAGRLHAYEGYPLVEGTLGVRVMRSLGVELLLVSNAAGGLNPNFGCGDLMAIEDHVHLMWDNPLAGPNDESLGPRFPDMSRPYDPDLIARCRRIARVEDIPLYQGVYVAVRGPNLETRAEYRFLRRLGDVVGMSTVPEVLVAAHCGLRVAAFSIVSNVCLPDALPEVGIDEIVATSNAAEPKLRRIVLRLLEELYSSK